jgi:hypothetical protein
MTKIPKKIAPTAVLVGPIFIAKVRCESLPRGVSFAAAITIGFSM